MDLAMLHHSFLPRQLANQLHGTQPQPLTTPHVRTYDFYFTITAMKSRGRL